MNFFSSSPDPFTCARALDDKRLGAQPGEVVLTLGDALIRRGHFGGLAAFRADRNAVSDAMQEAGIYRAYNPHGRFATWAAADWARWWWTYDLGVACCVEWRNRFGACRAERDVIDRLYPLVSEHETYSRPLTWPRCKATEALPNMDTHEAYREVLRQKWAAGSPTWTNTEAPAWRDGEPT